MKFYLLLFGLFFLLPISKSETKHNVSHQQSVEWNKQTCFESGSPDIKGEFEKTEISFFSSINNQLSYQKNRNKDASSRFYNFSYWFSQPVTGFYNGQASRFNLFLIFHFTLSLWQVFLQ